MFPYFCFQIISLITIVLTSWIIHEKDKTIDSFIDVLLDPSLMLLIVSCIALFITYMGALGALRENETMLVIVSYLYVIDTFPNL